MTFDLRSYLMGFATVPAFCMTVVALLAWGEQFFQWKARRQLSKRLAARRAVFDPVTPAVPQGDGDSTPISSRIVVEPWRNTGLHSHVRNAHWLRPIDAAAFNVLQHHYNNDHEADGA